MIEKNSQLWDYLSDGQKGLIETGKFLLSDAKANSKPLSDYSYIVFPFAKAYEGFLKQLFLDMGFISKNDYEGDRFRIGKALNPNFAKEAPQYSVYLKITNLYGNEEIAKKLWDAWKRGRNLLFHYFPHNLLAIDLSYAEEISRLIISVMKESFNKLKPKEK